MLSTILRLLLGLVLLGLFFLASGVFIVDVRQIAIVKEYNDKIKLYATGIHWRAPLLSQLDYVYTNLSAQNLSINESTSDAPLSRQLKLLINVQVIDPLVYFNYTSRHKPDEYNAAIETAISSKIQTDFKEFSNNADLIKAIENNFSNIIVTELGIKLVSINITNIHLVPTTLKPIILEPESSVPSLSIESTYYAALQIKNLADDQRSESLATLRAKNPKFFDYYMKIQRYSHEAKDKKEVPSFEQLYQNR